MLLSIPKPLLRFPPIPCLASSRFLVQTRVKIFGFLPSKSVMSNSGGQQDEISLADGDLPLQEETEMGKPKARDDDVIVQYVVLRRDLIDAWPLGSIVTQGCHASVSAIWEHKDDDYTAKYCAPTNLDSMHKVTLEVKGEAQILNLSEKLKAGGVAHKVWIEQPENIPTCLATKPYPKSTVSSFFKKLKLCK